MAVESPEHGGFVGTKSDVECAFDLFADVDGGGELLNDGELFGCLWIGFRREVLGSFGNRRVVFGRKFPGCARAEIMDGGIGRTSGFAFGSTWSRGQLRVAAICR